MEEFCEQKIDKKPILIYIRSVKAFRKSDIWKGAIALVLLGILVWSLFRPDYYFWRAKKTIRALWDPNYISDAAARIKCFEHLQKLSQIGHSDWANLLFAIGYGANPRMSPSTRENVNITLDLYANFLRTLPLNSVLIANSQNTLPLWFLQKVDSIRTDIVLIDRDFWRDPRYREYMMDESPLGFAFPREEILSDKFAGDGVRVPPAVIDLLKRKYPIFVMGDSAPEFPPESLYFVPTFAKMYRWAPMPDTVYAELLFRMLYGQNWNYIAEHPPTQNEKWFVNSGAAELGNILTKTTEILHNTGQDSLAQLLMRKFKPWLRWSDTPFSRFETKL